MKKRIIPMLLLFLIQVVSASAQASDIETLDNVIYVAPMTIENGTESATLSFIMKNSAAIRGFQFDLYLPDGVTAGRTSSGSLRKPKFNASRLIEEDEDEEIKDDHSILIEEQSDGAIRFLCNSMAGYTFVGNDGELFTMSINIAGIQDKACPIELKTMKLSEKNPALFYETASIATTLTIGTTGINEVNADGMQADGKYLINGELIIKKGNSIFNGIGAKKK